MPCFWFDFVDPASFVMHLRLGEAERRTDIRAIRRGFELVSPPEPPLPSADPAWDPRWHEVAAAASEMDLCLVRPSQVPWTRKAHELACHARGSGHLLQVLDALFRAHLCDGLDIGRIDVLVEIAAEAGLDRDETRTVLGVDRHLADVRSFKESAEREGVHGVPTLALGERRIEGLAGVSAITRLLAGR